MIEFKIVACYFTGALILIGVQRGKEWMNPSMYQQQLGATVACTKIIMEETKRIGQRYQKWATKDFPSFLRLILLK